MQSNHNNIEIRNSLISKASGKLSGIKNVHKYGANLAVGTTRETIWGVGGNKIWCVEPYNLQVLSNDLDDDINGLGAQQICLDGLDNNFNEQIEYIDLSGSAAVYSTKQFRRLNRAYVTKNGTYHDSNYADIEIAVSGGGHPMGVINGGLGVASGNSLYGAGQTENGFYTVPAGKTAYVSRVHASINVASNKTASLYMFITPNTDQLNAVRRLQWRVEGFNENIEAKTDNYFKIPEKTDIWFEAKATSSSIISVDFHMFLIDN